MQQRDEAVLRAVCPQGGTSSEQVSKLLPIKQRGGFWRMRDKPPGTDAEFYKVR